MKINELPYVGTSKRSVNLLAQKLWKVKDMDAVVVAMTPAAMPLAASLAGALELPLEALPGRVIRHPADGAKSIGSVTVDAVSCRDDINDIPRDYITHQLMFSQCAVRKEYESYYAKRVPLSFRNRVVILVDDAISTLHPMSACLMSVIRQRPLKVIVAAPAVTAEAARRIAETGGETEYLDMIHESDVRTSYSENTDQQQDRAKAILETYTRVYEEIPGHA